MDQSSPNRPSNARLDRFADATPPSSPRQLDDVEVRSVAAGVELVDVRSGVVLLFMPPGMVEALIGKLVAATPGDDLADQLAAAADDVLTIAPAEGMLYFRRALDEAEVDAQ